MAFNTNTYKRALEAQTRRIDDYQKVHFRKSHVPKVYDSVAGFVATVGSRNPEQPVLQPRVVDFSRATAKAFLQQTEPLWLNLSLSRQDATKDLLDRETGSFIVRSSTKAKYALTIRLEDNNPPVTHFLVHCNSQGFYSIQGSNLQFVSLYDMLAFFCFQQSGGMPCLLRPPVRRSKRDSYLLDSDDTESEGEEDEWENGEPGVSPPPSLPKYDEIRFLGPTQDQHVSTGSAHGPSSVINKPPPIPPRKRLQYSAIHGVSNEVLDRVNRVSSLVDNDEGALIQTVGRQESLQLLERPRRTKEEATPPTPSIDETRGGETVSNVGTKHFMYKNFQIMSENSTVSQKIGSHYEVAPVKEFVKVTSSAPLMSEGPPAIPPKARPPPVPPKVTQHDNEPSSDLPPPLPPKPEDKAGQSSTHYEPIDIGRRVMTQSSKIGRRRASSDSSIMSSLSEDVSSHSSPPPLPPNHPRQEEDKEEQAQQEEEEEFRKEERKELETNEGWTFVEKSELTSPPTTTTSNTPAKLKWKKPRWAKKLKKWGRKPRSRVKHYILDLSNNTTSVFGSRVHYFLETTPMKTEPHQKLFSDVRSFMGKMRELLLTDYKVQLLDEGMDSCRNFEHLLESTLQQCIIMPLYNLLYSRLYDSMVKCGSFQQIKLSIDNALMKTPEELGIRPHLLVPNEKSLQEINSIFTKLKESYNAMKKMEYLLEAVRLTYEAVRDANNPKKPMNDLGADEEFHLKPPVSVLTVESNGRKINFLPLFVWVLAHTNFTTAEVEAEYIWGLAHPSLFNGEGGYYLTTLTSAVNVLKECCVDKEEPDSPSKNIPNMNSLRTQLSIRIEDPETGKVGSPQSLPVLPTMTVSEICEAISLQYNIPSSEEYSLYTKTADKVTKLDDQDYPQEMSIGWELQSYTETDRPVLVFATQQFSSSHGMGF